MKRRLQPRETQVARMAAQGMSDKEIARELDVSVHTISAHIKNAFVKLGVNRRSMIADALKPTREQAERHAPYELTVWDDTKSLFIEGGYYTLTQLEAACVVARELFGPDAVGLQETINNEEENNDK